MPEPDELTVLDKGDKDESNINNQDWRLFSRMKSRTTENNKLPRPKIGTKLQMHTLKMTHLFNVICT